MSKVNDMKEEKDPAEENNAPQAEESVEEAAQAESSDPKDDESGELQAELDPAELHLALKDAKQEAEENWNKALRIQADFDNFRRRMDRELESTRKFAVEKLVVELLNVKDSVDMGIQAAKDEETDRAKLLEGLELTLKQFDSVFEKFNIKEINPLGEEFNPEYHEAMTMAPSDEVAENHVLSVFQKGYVLNDRLIRSAKVVVAKAKD